MIVAAQTTLVLAQLIGLYFIAGGIGGFAYGHLWQHILDDFQRSPALVLIAGAFAFTLGGVIVAIHNIWTDPVAIVITLFGWVSLAEGFAILAFHDVWLRLVRPMIGRPRVWATATLLLGAFLFVAGILGRADPLAL